MRGARTLVLTGAGLSTDSGIPDYRGPGSTPRNPMTYEQFISSEGFRRHYWARNHVGWRHMAATRPNDGHRALTALEAAGRVTGVVTQNVDTLHQRAGTRTVVDLHGSFDRVTCLTCGTVVPREALDARLTALNPGFRESHGPVGDIEIALVDDADVLLVAGSSLTVHSGLRFVRHAARRGTPVAIVNRGASRGDEHATLRLDAGTSETLVGLLPLLLPVPARPTTRASVGGRITA